MRQWMNILFYSIGFFSIAMVIYRLALWIPPQPGDEGYIISCIKVGVLSCMIAGLAIIPAAIFDWYQGKLDRESKR